MASTCNTSKIMIALLPLQRWTSLAANIPQAAAIMRDQIDAAHNLGCSLINIPLSEKLNYITTADTSILDQTRALHDHAHQLGLSTTQSGPLLLKDWGLAKRLTLPLRTDPFEHITLNKTANTDDSGRCYFPEVAHELGTVDEYKLIRLKIVTSQPGTFYLLHPDETTINKIDTTTGKVMLFSHVNLPGIKPANLVFVSKAAQPAHVVIISYSVNEWEPDETGFTGTKMDGFLHCRMPDPNDVVGITKTALMAERFLHGIPQICCSDELNSPFGHTLDSELYPHGWPQWIAHYLAHYAAVCKAQTGSGPLFFQVDPRADTATLKYNRYCKPIPDGSPTDYLHWLKKFNVECAIGIWGEGAPANFWRANFERVCSSGFEPVIMIYSGNQPIKPVIDGIGKDALRDLPIFVYYWQAEWPRAVATVNQLKQILA